MIFIAKVSTELHREFLQAMVSLQEEKMKEKGIRSSGVYWNVHDDKSFSVVDEWETEEDMQRFLDGDKFKVLIGALKVLCNEVEVNCGPLRRLMENGKKAVSPEVDHCGRTASSKKRR